MTRFQQFYMDTPEQFSFGPKHSTEHQLLSVLQFIHDEFDNSEMVGTLFIDVAKAFDTAWHSGLIYKLLNLKFQQVMFTLFSLTFAAEHLLSSKIWVCT